MSEARNTILQLPDTMEYIRAEFLPDGTVVYSVTDARALATPLTGAQTVDAILHYRFHYMIDLLSQDWIILNAKHNTDEVNTQP
jgi:hypothetical protein